MEINAIQFFTLIGAKILGEEWLQIYLYPAVSKAPEETGCQSLPLCKYFFFHIVTKIYQKILQIHNNNLYNKFYSK